MPTVSKIAQPLKFEPFDPEKHDRTAFSCGVDQVDNYFRKTANKLQKAENVRVFVLSTPIQSMMPSCQKSMLERGRATVPSQPPLSRKLALIRGSKGMD